MTNNGEVLQNMLLILNRIRPVSLKIHRFVCLFVVRFLGLIL